MNSSVACETTSCEQDAKIAAFKEAVVYTETDLYDVFSRMSLVKESELTPDQKVKFDKLVQRFKKCLLDYGFQEIPTDQ